EPVEAPDGTAARPMVPLSSSTSHSTVGLPRLSRISRPTMSTIALILVGPCWFLKGLRSGLECLLEERPRLDGAVELGELLEERAHVLERHRVRPVGERLRRIRMRFHEDAGDADRDRRARQHRHELALAARRRALAA